MERIKKALEKAHEQRQQTTDNNTWLDYATGAAQSVETDKIIYSQTRNIQVSDDVLRQNRIIASLDDRRTDLFRMLRTKILQRMQAKNWKLLAVTSPTQGAGKSTTAINLAISIAQDANYSVLLVDLDLRNPSIHRYLDIPVESGLSEYFSGKKSIAELLIHPNLEKLVLLPAGQAIQRSSDLLTTPKMQMLTLELKQRYPDRIVIVDLPPLLHMDDAMVFMPNVDACVLVAAEGQNSIEEVENSIELIDREKYVGYILNKSAELNSVYGASNS